LAAKEANNVSLLFGNHGISRRRGGFYRRTGSIGCEGLSKKNGVEEIVPNLNNNLNNNPNNKEK